MAALPALVPVVGGATTPPERSRRRRKRSSRAPRPASLELGRWEARNGVELPPRSRSTQPGFGRAEQIAEFNSTANGGQLLVDVDMHLPMLAQRDQYILSGLTKTENDEATAKLRVLRAQGMEPSQLEGSQVFGAVTPKHRANAVDPHAGAGSFDRLLVALKTGVDPSEVEERERQEKEEKERKARAEQDEDDAEAKKKAGGSFEERLAKRRPRPVMHRVNEKLGGYREHPMMMEQLEAQVKEHRKAERERAKAKAEAEAARLERPKPVHPEPPPPSAAPSIFADGRCPHSGCSCADLFAGAGGWVAGGGDPQGGCGGEGGPGAPTA